MTTSVPRAARASRRTATGPCDRCRRQRDQIAEAHERIVVHELLERGAAARDQRIAKSLDLMKEWLPLGQRSHTIVHGERVLRDESRGAFWSCAARVTCSAT